MLVSLDQLNESSNRYYSLENKLGRNEVENVSEEELLENVDKNISEHVAKGNILTSEENLVKRKEMIETLGQEPVDFAFERAIGNNDSVYSNFVELIAFAKQKVGRIVIKTGNKNIGYATGFMVSERLLLTNWHVFQTEESVAESEVEFFYEIDIFGRPGKSVSFKLNCNDFFYSFKELDYCFVAVSPVDVTNTVNLSSIGYIFLDPALGKLGNEREELLNIIHHPDGDYKQLSIRENLFTKIMPTTLWYESDTAQGSSGSPVFNDQWQVVALHHLGVADKTADGDYVDKNGRIIPEVDGKIDVSRINWIANEGIRISVILKDINSKYPTSGFINALINPPGSSNIPNLIDIGKPPSLLHENKPADMDTSNNDKVQISFPASLISATGSINININNYSSGVQPSPIASMASVESGGMDEDFTEVKKIEREDAIDYSDCKGYYDKFLGIKIPLPRPNEAIQKFIAKLKNSDATVLKYYHYSLIFHSVRMMPVISAINVDGDTLKRKDESKRDDDWLRDNRLDYDLQLNDKYYKGSGFDRGHMSRREDANWASTPALAKLYADMTCMYTNACPQVAKLNQGGRGGVWGKLEKAILEDGAIQERGKTAKITVFNGPIFQETDSVFRGIQVPLDFYKIILWLNDDKKLKATAFRLSQTTLVSDIDFEAIDIDANVEFQEYQCSIESLERDTHLDFSAIKHYDTFDPSQGNEVAINSEEELLSLIKMHN